MPPPSWTDTGFLIANWEVRPRHGTLRRRDDATAEPVKIEPRVMAVLACLARRGGEVVTRDEFSAEVWSGRIVTDEALSRCISVLRQALGDDSREPRFIRTIARIGYALVPTPVPLPLQPAAAEPLPVATATAAAAAAATAAVAGGPPLRLPWPSHQWLDVVRRRALLAAAAVGLILAAAWLYARLDVRTGTEPPPPVTRLLVLPFDTSAAKSTSPEAGAELADAIADSLAHVEQLQISGRTSADKLAAAHTGALAAGRKLGVDAVLTGTVADRAGGLHVDTRLMATRDAHVLWSRTDDIAAGDMFALQNGIAAAVVRQLLGVLNREGLAGTPPAPPDSRDYEAYQLYLRGAHQFRLRGEDSLRRAIDLYSAAARRDPTYARAQVGLASAYALLPSYSYEDPDEMYALAEKALANADRLSHGRAASAGTRGYIAFMRGRWSDSETAFRTAIVADPNNPEVRQMYSQLLGAVGRIEAALTQIRQAQEIDPLAPVIADRLGILQLWLGRDAEAARYTALARELGLDEVAYPETQVLLKLHQHADADAAEELRSLQRSLHRSDAWIEPTLEAYRHPEKRADTIKLLDRSMAAGDLSARLYFGAMVLLESPARALRGYQALPDRGGNDLEFLFSPDAAAVRRDPAFGEFIRSIGIEAYWDRFGWPNLCGREAQRIVCH